MSDIIFLSERGWQGARTHALELARQGKTCQVLVKGRPSKEVREFISKHPCIKSHFIPRQLFFIYFPIYVLIKKILRQIDFVYVERPKALKVLQRVPFTIKYYEFLERDNFPYYEIKDPLQVVQKGFNNLQ